MGSLLPGAICAALGWFLIAKNEGGLPAKTGLSEYFDIRSLNT
jgi:hypothetical protein